MRKTIVIDCFPDSVRNYRHGYTVVAIDVIRATTSAITVAAGGGRCFPVASGVDAHCLAKTLKNPLLAGEIGGDLAPGFEINNSPAELASRNLVGRSVILLSSSGTRLITQAKGCDAVHLACLRNYGYVAGYLADYCERVALIGAGSRGEFRKEDQMCCAWIARELAAKGYVAENRMTSDLIYRWSAEGPEAMLKGKSADYLRRSGQVRDLEFILAHINDLDAAFVMQGDELAILPAGVPAYAVARYPVRNTVPAC